MDNLLLESLLCCLQLSSGAKITLIVSGGTTLGQAEAAKAEAERHQAAASRRLQKEQKTKKLNARLQKDKERANADTLKASSILPERVCTYSKNA